MDGILRKILSVGKSSPKSDDGDYDNNIEYSIAIEYHGPPVTFDIPKAVPVDVDQLPTAATVSSSFVLKDISLPIIQPIVKTTSVNQKLSKDKKFGSERGSARKFNDRPGVSNESSTQVDSLDSLGQRIDDGCRTKLCDGIGSSGILEISDVHDSLGESSGGLAELEPIDDQEEGLGLQKYMDLPDSDSTESVLSSPALSSSEVFSQKGEEVNNETPCHVKRPSVVTFRDPESCDMVQGESGYSETESIHAAQPIARNGKKGSCYRCLKGNRFTEKEICIVCNAKYCCKCVLRAMGSMPEGRKCVTCIGKKINESRRGSLGKCSRLLKRLLNELEVQQAMNSERTSEANQLPLELVVNGEPLSQDEWHVLQTCQNPPNKLKPGFYWYDKLSGFWGREGHGPCQIITAQLNVGGLIKADASNGNTKVLINNREITKKELWMLQLAGVHCEGKPSFWLSADGSYQEEGQKNVKGPIWDKRGIKLICALLSIPVPPDFVNPSGEDVSQRTLEQRALHKLLLVGYQKSGTSTIYKQAKILYNIPFSENERQNIKSMIQSNLYGYIAMLLEGREWFEEESLLEIRKGQIADASGSSGSASQIDGKTKYSISARLKSFSDWLVQVMVSGNLEGIFPAATCEYAPFIQELWNDAAFQATYNRRHELEILPRVATYFLERAVEISRTDYEPSDVDIVYAEGITSSNGISCMEFSFPTIEGESSIDGYQHDPLARYQLIRLHPSSLGENCKWVEMFEDIDIVLFCVSLTDYDEFVSDSNGVLANKMLASKQLFESIVTHPNFEQKDFLLILNKVDLLKEKILQVPLTQCDWFHDFNPVISNNRNNHRSLAQSAFHYIAVKFKRLFDSLTDRKLYVSMVTGLEPGSVDEALRYTRDILKWDDTENSFFNNELSSTDIEASSTS
ncbi:extra-large guanine nucleotide-binding protein 1-like isoform X1 [Durio zibethinus]|uniref:Extra-large guanine nucleotide-binding protein 1-like isoform X1 n=1 Tax=Durio zibethinus TaxID=66656 RepID=A0A6P5Z7Y3_DURZI|nr:extra-large guanine nucleotide-binding protein 1-like isoform X1 [Durio zibethinus]